MAYRSLSWTSHGVSNAGLYVSHIDGSQHVLPAAIFHTTRAMRLTSRNVSRIPHFRLISCKSQQSHPECSHSRVRIERISPPQISPSVNHCTRRVRSIHSNGRIKGDGAGDWYGRWERHKRRQYEALRRHIEENPYDALFGASNRWLGWLKYSTVTPATRTSSTGLHCTSPYRDRGGKGHENMSPDAASADSAGRKSSPSQDQVEDYEIDPITLRKRPLQTRDAGTNGSSTSKDGNEGSIPVKTFEQHQAELSAVKTTRRGTQQMEDPNLAASTGWLSEEGFGNHSQSPKKDEHRSTIESSTKRSSSSLESALDRHVQKSIRQDKSARSPSARLPKWSSFEPSRVYSPSRGAHDSLPQISEESTSIYQKDQRKEGSVKDKVTLPTTFEGHQDRKETQSYRSVTKPEPWQTSHTESQRCTEVPRVKLEAASAEADRQKPPQWRSPGVSPKLTSIQVARLRSKLVPLKTRIDTLKDDYASLQHQIMQEKRRFQEHEDKKLARQAQARMDNALRQEVDLQKDAMKDIESRPRNTISASVADDSLAPEFRGEGDIASNVHEFLGRARWYKRKAPHANCEMDAKMRRLEKEKSFVREIRGIYEDTYGTIDCSHRQPASIEKMSGTGTEDKMRTKSRDTLNSSTRADAPGIGALELFVATELDSSKGDQHLRDTAAKIDESIRAIRQCDRQNLSENIFFLKRNLKVLLEQASMSQKVPSLTSPKMETALDQPPSSTYRILAYDHATQKVTSAKTESSTPLTNNAEDGKEASLAMHHVLTKLYNPGKFLPHLHSLQSRGFDVVSVTGDVVVLKKVREPDVARDDYHGRPNPIDGTTTPEVSAGNFASPTGYVNYGPVIPPEEQRPPQPATPRSEDKVIRQEDVFSGDSDRWHESKASSKKSRRRARKWQTLKKMLLTGTITGALCYGVGMIEENRLLS